MRLSEVMGKGAQNYMVGRRSFIAGATCAMAALLLSTASAAVSLAAGASVGGVGEGLREEATPELDMSMTSQEAGYPVNRRQGPPYYVEGVMNLHNAHFGETYRYPFRDGYGNYDGRILSSLDWVFRCNYDQAYLSMDLWVVELLNYVSKHLGDPLIRIHSGYRTPGYNAMLRRRSEGVARNSLHMYGQAIDFSVPGLPIRKVCQVAMLARNRMGYGGIGYYPSAGFIHLDSGRHRTWAG